MNKRTVLFVTVLLTGCAVPPQPPTVDGTSKQQINTEQTLEDFVEVQSVKRTPKRLLSSKTLKTHVTSCFSRQNRK